MGRSKRIIEKLSLLEMANASKKETGLPVVSWFHCKTGKEKHGPRFKVQDNYSDRYVTDKLISVTISDDPSFVFEPENITSSDQKLIIKWTLKNKDGLLDLWNRKISHMEFLKSIKK